MNETHREEMEWERKEREAHLEKERQKAQMGIYAPTGKVGSTTGNVQSWQIKSEQEKKREDRHIASDKLLDAGIWLLKWLCITTVTTIILLKILEVI